MGLSVVSNKSKKKKKSGPAKPKTSRAKPKKSAAKSAPSKPMPAMAMKGEADWRAEDDARTLMQAEEIKRDPARLRRAKERARKKAAEAQAVARIG